MNLRSATRKILSLLLQKHAVFTESGWGSPNSQTSLPMYNDALDLRANVECEKHKKAVRGETSLAKVTIFFLLHRETNQMMLY